MTVNFSESRLIDMLLGVSVDCDGHDTFSEWCFHFTFASEPMQRLNTASANTRRCGLRLRNEEIC